jgi:D-alanine-D-alanine ligase
MAGADRKIPAPISEELTSHIQGLAVRTFQVLDCAGVARIDFLVDAEQNVYVNEINTIPGSYSYYLWTHQDIEFPKLGSELIDLAFKAHAQKNALTYTYTTNLLSQAGASLAKLKKGEKLGGRRNALL